ncbi:MAG: hypothetical protein ABW032_07615 [Burkholderiaceae bacterium]
MRKSPAASDRLPAEPAADPARKPPAGGGGGTRARRTPLTPAHVGHAIGDGADPGQDVAPNLGGEDQMQDA